ncbi:MAG: hypothetical protein PHR99_04385 [Methanobacteriales archaeon]|nr:hypothetical protein [Methanobacteriales archaeon]
MVNILLLSEDPNLTEPIRSWGYDPILVDSEEDILEAGSKAELIIVDMPKPTSLVKAIKKLEKRSNLPIY